MADLEKCLPVKIKAGEAMCLLTYSGERYLKILDKGTAAGTTFKLNGTGSDLTGVVIFDCTVKHEIDATLTGSTVIVDNTGSVYYKQLLNVHEDLGSGLVGATPKGKRGG
jgi:hypothetical protein